jgi:hypothetical protein
MARASSSLARPSALVALQRTSYGASSAAQAEIASAADRQFLRFGDYRRRLRELGGRSAGQRVTWQRWLDGGDARRRRRSPGAVWQQVVRCSSRADVISRSGSWDRRRPPG